MQTVAALKVSARGNTALLEALKRLPGQPFGRPQSLAHAADLDAATSAAKAKWRHAAEGLAEHVAHLDSDNKAWYALASRLYGAETPEGALLRSRVPVTTKS